MKQKTEVAKAEEGGAAVAAGQVTANISWA